MGSAGPRIVLRAAAVRGGAAPLFGTNETLQLSSIAVSR